MLTALNVHMILDLECMFSSECKERWPVYRSEGWHLSGRTEQWRTGADCTIFIQSENVCNVLHRFWVQV